MLSMEKNKLVDASEHGLLIEECGWKIQQYYAADDIVSTDKHRHDDT